MKEHFFTIKVRTAGPRSRAETALLLAFGTRQPDGCEFDLQKSPPPKKDGWKPISTAPREREILLKTKNGMKWIGSWSVRFNCWRCYEGQSTLSNVTHWREIP